MNRIYFACVYFLLFIFGYPELSDAQWQIKSPMPLALTGVSAVEFEGRIYLIGGKNENQYMDRVDIYDPVTDTWDTSSATRLQFVRANTACVSYHDRIWIIGGRDRKGASKKVEVYDPETNTWVTTDDLKGPRDGAVAQILNDSLKHYLENS